MNANDLKIGDTVYWGKDGEGVVQSKSGIFVTVRIEGSDRRPSMPTNKLRKQP